MKKLLPLIAVCLASCATTQSDFVTIGQSYAAKPIDHTIDVFEADEKPSRPFEVVAEVFTTKEATHFITYSLEDALVELKAQAREAGADAIMAIEEERSRHLETSKYLASGKAIRYTD